MFTKQTATVLALLATTALASNQVQQAQSWDPFYEFTLTDWQGLGFGSLSGAGYAATIWLPDCGDAGFEVAATAFMIYEWFSNQGFTDVEKILGPIFDYVQVGLSFFYMYACVSKNYTGVATEAVFWGKYLQAAVLPYVIVMTYLNGPRHDMFMASFASFKLFFNILDSSNYFNI
jgi:hypothetical protein